MTEKDTHYMALALTEARKGLGRTSPNPAVGAVIVRDDVVVGCGYHHRAGEPHAEVNAILDAKGNTAGATIYVTLEPCNHSGKTPPCTQAILDAGLDRVVIGLLDPNPHVLGGGKKFLQDKGLAVEAGVLEQECKALVYPFIKYSQTQLPWVILKAGLSLDGKITYAKGEGGTITGTESHDYVHQLRNQVDAILIGSNTALIDNPSLTTRLHHSPQRDPLRVVLDSRLRISPQANMLHQNSNADTVIFHAQDTFAEKKDALKQQGCRLVSVNRVPETGFLDLNSILTWLGRQNVVSVLVEGGAHVHGSFLNQELVDEINLFYAPFFIGPQGQGIVQGYGCHQLSAAERFSITEVLPLGDDVLIKGIRPEHV
ncbi:MAG: riboflavin biosynthesis protein RibD [Desulfobulbus propionicus]|nr:MAG: riboflavin biosynthesis protein RibD [Desulfobulbus propionicus]